MMKTMEKIGKMAGFGEIIGVFGVRGRNWASEALNSRPERQYSASEKGNWTSERQYWTSERVNWTSERQYSTSETRNSPSGNGRSRSENLNRINKEGYHARKNKRSAKKTLPQRFFSSRRIAPVFATVRLCDGIGREAWLR